MAAIFGAACLSRDGSVDESLLERMVAASTARSREGAVFAGTPDARLAIRGHPGPSAVGRGGRGVIAVADGKPLNAPALARRLAVTPTDLLPALYLEHGDDFMDRIQGGFSLAVADPERRRVVIARDHVGVKPLYFAVREEILLFASELKALLATGLVRPVLDHEAIDAYLGFGFVPSPRTLLRDVSKLIAGHRVVLDDGNVTQERFWNYPEPQPDTKPRPEILAEELSSLLEESVIARLDESVTGIMLSGGLDSSILARLAVNAGHHVKTFTVGFAETRGANELEPARAFARAIGTEHHEIEISMRDAEPIESAVWSLEDPVADLSVVGLLALCSKAAPEVGALLSGQGADGLLGGQPAHRTAKAMTYARYVPRPVREAAAVILRMQGGERSARLGRILAASSAPERFLAAADRLAGDRRSQILRPPLADLPRTGTDLAVSSRWHPMAADPLGAYIFIDEQLAAPDGLLHYVDRAAAAGPVDARFPFLDRRIVEFCARVPPRLKVHGTTKKYLLRVAARGLVPDGVVDRPKVGFFNSSVTTWHDLRGREDINRYLTPDARCAEFVDLDHVLRADSDFQLRVLMLEVWLASYLPRAMAQSQVPLSSAVSA